MDLNIKLLVGQNIRKIRKYQGLTQTDLSKMLDLSRASVANIEAGKQNVGLDNLHDIAVALQVPVGMLLDGAESEKNIIEGINVKYKMLEIKYEKLQKQHQKLVDNITELIKK